MDSNAKGTVTVWDPLVRLFHWSLVLVFVIAYLTGEEESDLHAYAGYVVLGLVVFRILWGFVGPTYARFSNFIYSPESISEYLKSLFSGQPRHYLGHNPAAGIMVVLLLSGLLVATLTGLKAYGVEGHGPLAANAIQFSPIGSAQADDDYDERYDEFEHRMPGQVEHEGYNHDEEHEADEFWEELHEASIDFLLLLVFVHIAGVLVSSYLHKENLLGAMFTGRKKENIEM